MWPAKAAGIIADMTTTPEDQDWLRLAEEVFDDATNQPGQEASPDQMHWRYRAPAI